MSQAVGQTEGKAVFRYYPAMPGNSTCHVHEKQQLQREHMAGRFFADSQDCVCPVTTISHLMDQHGTHEIHLLKVRLCEAVCLTMMHLVLRNYKGNLALADTYAHDTMTNASAIKPLPTCFLLLQADL